MEGVTKIIIVIIIIVIIVFMDREDELKSLKKEWKKDKSNFIIIYGRRRIGKTELIKKFSENKPHIYFLAPQDTEEMQRNKLLEIISKHFNLVGKEFPSS